MVEERDGTAIATCTTGVFRVRTGWPEMFLLAAWGASYFALGVFVKRVAVILLGLAGCGAVVLGLLLAPPSRSEGFWLWLLLAYAAATFLPGLSDAWNAYLQLGRRPQVVLLAIWVAGLLPALVVAVDEIIIR